MGCIDEEKSVTVMHLGKSVLGIEYNEGCYRLRNIMGTAIASSELVVSPFGAVCRGKSLLFLLLLLLDLL